MAKKKNMQGQAEDMSNTEFSAQSDPQPGALVDGFTEPGPDVIAIDAVEMIRPEDRSESPVVAQVASDDVDHWKSHGWIVKE